MVDSGAVKERVGHPGDLKALEQGIGWASLALGLPQTLAPRAFARVIGAPDGRVARQITLAACGPRELTAAVGILALERPWPRRTLQLRLAGDLLDVGLLALSFRSRPRSRVRLAVASGAALTIGTADLLALLRAKEQADGDTTPSTVDEHPMQTGKAVTIRASRAQVEQRWATWDGVAPRAAASFTEAPGDRGTELRIDLQHPDAGPSGPAALLDAARKLTGTAYEQQVADDLRRFKSTVETGEVLRSDGSPEGPSAPRLRTQRPAQPLSETTTKAR